MVGDSTLDSEISTVARSAGMSIPALTRAALETGQVLARFTRALHEMFPPESPEYRGIDVVFFGSLARQEMTRDSDCDYLVLVNKNDVDVRVVTRIVVAVDQLLREFGLSEPGRQGIFGDFVVTSELAGRIGLDVDSNTSTTRRLLLLLESVSAYAPDERSKAIQGMLRRYCADYESDGDGEASDSPVPRFLLNDITRLWRTITVDFGAKRWRSLSQDSFVRYSKLVTTRKVLFAGSLATLFVCPSIKETGKDQGVGVLLQHLSEEFDRAPLARLMSAHTLVSADGKRALESLLQAYETFVDLMDQRGSRDALNAPTSSRSMKAGYEVEEIRSSVREMAATIQSSLEVIFFDEAPFKDLTRKYGLF